MKKLLKIIQNFLTYIFLVKVKYTPETYHVTLQFQVEFLSKNKKRYLCFSSGKSLNTVFHKKRVLQQMKKYLFQDQKTTIISAFSYGSRNRPLNGNNADIPFTLKRMAAEDKRWFYPPSYVLFIGLDEKSGGSIFHDK